jgi:hypothetical protein
VQLVHLPRAQSEFLLRQDHNAAPLRRFVGERRELRGIRELFFRDPRRRMKRYRHAVAHGDRARFIEQQHIDITRGFDRPA